MTDPIGEKLVALLPRLRRYARSLTGSTTDADDLVQSALEKALRSAHQWTPGTRLDWWMFCIVRSVRVDQLRKRSEAALDAGTVEKSLAPVDGPKVVESRLMLDAVRRAFPRLSEEQREILHLVCVDGLAYREAAEILDIPLGTVMSRLSRARLALHEALATRDAAKDAEEDQPMEKGH